MKRILPALGWGLCALLTALLPARAEVFHSRESALELAFPGADRIEPRDLLLTGTDARKVCALSGVKPSSRMVTVYAGYKNGVLTGYAFLDTHPVRTLPETLMLVLTPQGEIRGTHLLAFHEPP
ncbi:MAG: FMN-binding protein, partial [Gemmatimonadetes bacterium]|nr:FMN-binding protein [Gemmatimonadota bacterium]